MRIDTKNAGFVVVDVPLQSEVTVSGSTRREGGDLLLDADGIRY